MTHVVSGGRMVPVGTKSFPVAYTSVPQTQGPSGGIVTLLSGDYAALSYEGMYRSQPYVYAAVNKWATSIGRIPFKAYETNANGSRRESRGSDLDRLIRNPFPRGSAYDLKSFIGWSLAVHGNAFFVKARKGAGAAPYELWPIPWKYVQVVKDARGILGYNLCLTAAESYAVDPTDVVHVALPEGISPMEALRRTLALEDAAITWQGQSFANGVTMRGAFTTDQRLNDATMPRLRADLEQMYSGPENGGRFGVFDQGLKFTPMSQSAVDAELIGQRKLSREEVAAAYDLLPLALGITEGQNYAMAKESRAAHYQDSMGAKYVMIEDAFNAQLVYPEAAWDGQFLEFNLDAVLRPDPETRARTHMMNEQAGVSTANERRALENLPPIDDPLADAILLPLNMQPVADTPLPTLDPTQAGQGGADGMTEALRTAAIQTAMTPEK